MSNIIKEIEAEQLKETVDQFEVGDTVKVGQLIGDSEAAVSAPIHSSVSGKVKAIEQIFGVKVEKVNTIRMEGKAKRQGVTSGRRANWKKAMVKLTADSKTIEFFEGMV